MGISINENTLETAPQAASSPKLKNIGFYRATLAPGLSQDVFKPEPWRLVWYAADISIALFSFYAIVHFRAPWPVKLALGLVLGFCNGTMAFIGHEILHGSVVKSQKLQNILGFFGAIPFFISPTFWRFWHNRLHHGKTQQLITDPDAFPNLRIYKSSRFMKFMFPFTPGSGHKRSALYLFFWFSFHNFVAQAYLRFRNRIFADLDQKRVTIEFVSQILIAAALLAYAGPQNWLWVFVVPLFVQNYVVMSYVVTNHNLSPLTNENDPLVNSLTVTNYPALEFINLNFGYHVEHHIFPTMSSKHMKTIHRKLKEEFPETFQIMPKWKAMKELY